MKSNFRKSQPKRGERGSALEIERNARQNREEILKNEKYIKRELDATFYDVEKINYSKDKGKDGGEILSFYQEPLIELSIAKRLSGIWKLRAEVADKLWDEIKESEPLRVRNKLLQQNLEHSDS